MKSAFHYFVIVIYVRRVVYDMVINILGRITSNDKRCFRRVDMGGNSIEILISGAVFEKRQQNKFPTSNNLCELRKR